MAHLPRSEILARHQAVIMDIVSEWQKNPGWQEYMISCPCFHEPACDHGLSEDFLPRIIIKNCLYIGELDKLFVEQPLLEQHGFKVTWICYECHTEYACGFPMN